MPTAPLRRNARSLRLPGRYHSCYNVYVTAALLQTKLYLPIPRPDRVPRPRLTQALDAVLQPGRKVVLVSAPAGSGKTTLVAAWLQELDQPTASSPNSVPIFEPCWLSLDEGDNDLARFLVYLVAALERVAPGLGEGALSLLRGPQQPPAESFMTALINDILTLTQEEATPGRLLVMVLDDYHLIHSQAVHEIVTFLLDHLPSQMRLILVSRTEPPLPLARLRGRGHLLTLDGGDLRFTDEEARLFLNRVMGLELSQDDVAALSARTEGWIAGLQMAALALGAHRPEDPDDAGRPDSLTGDQLAGSRFIMDYLLQEVLEGQPAELQAFLLQTAILERLSGPLCDAVTDQARSQATLAELERRNLFLFPMDQEGRWYRYHHLFAELLSRRLQQTQPALLADLHRRAGAWYQANGFTAEAIHHALAAGDDKEAARLVEAAADPALMRGQFQTTLSWLQLLPEEEVRARPRLGVYQAFLMVLDSQPLAEIEVILRAAEDAASAHGDQATGEAMLIRAVLALLQGDLQAGTELSQQAMTLLPQDAPFMISLALRNLASVYSMTGDVAAANKALATASDLAERMGDKTSLVMTLYSLSRVCIQQGRLHAARDHLLRALSIGRDRRGRPLPIAARVLTSLADINREWNDLKEAARLAQDGIELTKQALAFWSIGGYATLAQIRQAEGNMAAAQAAMDAARELAIRFDATDLDDRAVELYQAQLWLAQGDVEATVRWAAGLLDAGAGGTQRPGQPRLRQRGQIAGWYVVHELEQIHLARLRLVQGQPEEAQRLLEGLRPAAESHKRTGSVIAIDLLLALTWQATGDLARALDTLEGAMALAEPEGLVRIFLDEGPTMANLLEHIQPESSVAAYAEWLLDAYKQSVSLPKQPGVAPAAGHALPDPLSEREMDVLRLLPTHLTSTEIAGELNISANTARFHIKNIYSKLSAHNRAEAVAQARQLDLI
ncbi:MAG TPA: LuxR C-terminal-related transcriptional regulator [Anaerolineae bacterium]|nr:LuxR C-terminal-related transcriptional regulator [Anaerolineae bacterium]